MSGDRVVAEGDTSIPIDLHCQQRSLPTDGQDEDSEWPRSLSKCRSPWTCKIVRRLGNKQDMQSN